MWSLVAESQVSSFKTVNGERCDRHADDTPFPNNALGKMLVS